MSHSRDPVHLAREITRQLEELASQLAAASPPVAAQVMDEVLGEGILLRFAGLLTASSRYLDRYDSGPDTALHETRFTLARAANNVYDWGLSLQDAAEKFHDLAAAAGPLPAAPAGAKAAPPAAPPAAKGRR